MIKIIAVLFLLPLLLYSQTITNETIVCGSQIMKNDNIHTFGITGQPVIGVADNASENWLVQSGFCYTLDELWTGIGIDISPAQQPVIPTAFHLQQNYPNPFNATTKIAFDVPESDHVTLELFNNNGQKVGSLVEGYLKAGRYEISLCATELPSGIYYYCLKTKKYSDTKSMILLK